jgi:acyl-CoA thioester hydrolase
MHLLYKGVVHPWHCDVMGHLNTRHYLGMFDDASYQLLHEATGWSATGSDWQGRGFADVHNSIDYIGEMKAGELIEINGGISQIGNSSFTARYVMTNRLTGETAATMMAKLIYFDLVKRKSIPLTDQIKQKMLTRWIDVDE